VGCYNNGKLFLIYFSSLLLYTTTIYYILQRLVCVYILLLYTIYTITQRYTTSLSPIYTISIYYGALPHHSGLYYYILLYSTMGVWITLMRFFSQKLGNMDFLLYLYGGGVYIKKVYNKLDTFPHECG
jgi:hypothetical protein